MSFTLNVSTNLPTISNDLTASIAQRTDLSISMSDTDVSMMQTNSSFSVMCHPQHVDDLLQTPGCGGIRLYPANANIGMATSPIASFLVVAVDGNGEDLVSTPTPCYICQPDGNVNKVSVPDATDMINAIRPSINAGTVFEPLRNLSGSGQEYFKATFTKKVVEDVLATSNIESVRFDIVQLNVQGNLGTLKTLAVSPADSSGNIIGDNAELSLLPCPPNCSGGYID